MRAGMPDCPQGRWDVFTRKLFYCHVRCTIKGRAQFHTSADGMRMAADWGVVMRMNVARAMGTFIFASLGLI